MRFVDQATTGRTEAFYAWERYGRGWHLFDAPVQLEPVFSWPQIHLTPRRFVDDTKRLPWYRRLFSEREVEAQKQKELLPQAYCLAPRKPLRELLLTFPPGLSVPPEHSVALLASLTTLTHPLSFELVAEAGQVRLRVVCTARDQALLTATLGSIAPEVGLERARPLSSLWPDSPGRETVFVEFGLGREFMVPLGSKSARGLDTLTPLITGLASLKGGVAVLQTLLVPTEAPWAQATLEAVTTPAGKPFFADAPEITRAAAEKLDSPLFAVVLRLAVNAETTDAAYSVVRSVAGGLARLSSPSGNELIPLASGDTETLVSDLTQRVSRRTGMLLSARELAKLVRLPSAAATTTLLSPVVVGKAAPAHTQIETDQSVRLGRNRGGKASVYLTEEERLRHVHVLGASGVGKSTLLVQLILQDVAADRGVAVFDPHGDLVDEVLARLPEERTQDVILFDPADPEAVVGWNVLSAESEAERQLLASDLVAVFRRLATSWGDQMTTVLANAILAFLDCPGGGTLLDLRRFLVDKAFRDRVVATLSDPHLQSFWRVEFPLIAQRKPQAPILTRLDTLLRHRLVRDVVTMREGALDFRAVIDEGRVFLARLAQGSIGRENASLLGSLLAARFHHTALSRQDTTASKRGAFFLYLDEFHELATPSMATLFSGLRKYGVGLTVAHHSLYQLRSAVPEVERAVLDNAHTRIVFRVGEEDARRLAAGFSGFDPADISGLHIGQAIARIGGSGDDFDLLSAPLAALDEAEASKRRKAVRAASQARWARPRRSTQRETAPEAETAPSPPTEKTGSALRELAEAARDTEKSKPPVARARNTGDAEGLRQAEPIPDGRGGPEHRYLQSLIREWAQARGYKVTLEYELDSGGRVDLVLEQDAREIAVEISVTTGYEHEIENVRKCLAHNFERVFVVSAKHDFLKRIEKLLTELLDKKKLERVKVVTPETLLSWLSDEPVTESKVAGYTVRTQRSDADSGDAQNRRKRLADVIGASLQRINKDDKG